MKFDFDPVNDRLYTISDILDHEIRADETLMGNFVSDYDDVIKIYAPFAERWRTKHGLLNADEKDEEEDSKDSPSVSRKRKRVQKRKKMCPSFTSCARTSKLRLIQFQRKSSKPSYLVCSENRNTPCLNTGCRALLETDMRHEKLHLPQTM